MDDRRLVLPTQDRTASATKPLRLNFKTGQIHQDAVKAAVMAHIEKHQ
jgi:hypothetical protein